MSHRTLARRVAVPLMVLGLLLLTAGVVVGHEEREVAGYDVEVGFMNEPVYVGDKSGLEFFVHKGDAAVTGLETTLKAEVIKGDSKRDLPINARWGEDGAYESVFIPTASGPYTFHIFGTIEGNAVDESFTSSPDGFNEVKELASGQFPVQFPAQADLVADAKAGKDAASQATIATALGAAALVVGLIGVGLALARRRPTA